MPLNRLKDVIYEPGYRLLENFIDPVLGKSWANLKIIQSCTVTPECIDLALKLPYPTATVQAMLHDNLKQFLQQSGHIQPLHLMLTSDIGIYQVQPTLKPHPEIKNIIAVASGKGGVGKSTTTSNLAAALHLSGAKVGILDADVYGPSQPQIMGGYEKIQGKEGKMAPVMHHGIATMSIGYLVEEDAPMIWRGPMISQFLLQLLNDTYWQGLDYLLIDLPPGTGDIQLTLCQKVPLTGAVIVTTPQDLALTDARRAIAMFREVNVAVLGVIENMSMYHCSACGQKEAIFGQGAATFIAEHDHVEVLGSLPLHSHIRQDSDEGCPTVLREGRETIRAAYIDAALKLVGRLSLCKKDFSRKIPKVVAV